MFNKTVSDGLLQILKYLIKHGSIAGNRISWDWNIGLMPYSQRWRNHRREIHQYFNQREVFKFEPVQLRECRAFLRRVLESPDDIGLHLRLLVSSVRVLRTSI